jgi:hypothetical protein
MLDYVGEALDDRRNDAREWRELILKFMDGASDDLQKALLVLERCVSAGTARDTEELKLAVKVVQEQCPTFIDRANDFLVNQRHLVQSETRFTRH